MSAPEAAVALPPASEPKATDGLSQATETATEADADDSVSTMEAKQMNGGAHGDHEENPGADPETSEEDDAQPESNGEHEEQEEETMEPEEQGEEEEEQSDEKAEEDEGKESVHAAEPNGDSGPPPPTPVPAFALPCMKGVLEPDPVSGVHVWAGMWGMNRESHNIPGHISAFEYRHNPPTKPTKVPSIGSYSGFFMLKQPPPKAPLRIDEKGVEISFVPNNAGGYNVSGQGTNRFGKFTITGVLETDGKLEMYRMYTPVKGSPGPKSPKSEKRKAGGARNLPGSQKQEKGGGQVSRVQRANRGSWKDKALTAVKPPAEVKAKKVKAAPKAKKASAPPRSSVGDDSIRQEDEPLQASRAGRQRKLPAYLKELPDADAEKRRGTEELKRAQAILTYLMKDNQSFWFANPVDPVALKIPDYFDIVKEPMDLGSVRQKLATKEYQGLEDFAEDVRLTFSNAIMYNTSAEHPVRKAAKALSLSFEQKFRQVKGELDAKRAIQEQKTASKSHGKKSLGGGARRASSGTASKADGRGRGRKLKGPRHSAGAGSGSSSRGGGGAAGVEMQAVPTSDLLAMQRQISAMQNTINQLQRQSSQADMQRQRAAPAAASPSFGSAATNKVYDVPVTHSEKRELTQAIQELPMEKMDKVVQIISERFNLAQSNGGDEIELDVDLLDTATIRELQNYVAKHRKRKGSSEDTGSSKRRRGFEDDDLFLGGEFE